MYDTKRNQKFLKVETSICQSNRWFLRKFISKRSVGGERQINVIDDQHVVVNSSEDSGSAERDSKNALKEPLDPQQSFALPSQFTQNSTMRHSERERRFPGKYVDLNVTYSVLAQEFANPQNQRSRDPQLSVRCRPC